MNKVEILPSFPLCCQEYQRYYDLLRLPSRHLPFRVFLIGFCFTFLEKKKVRGRVSPVPWSTFSTCRSPYSEGFLGAVFQVLHTVHWSSPTLSGLDFPLSSIEGSFDEAAGFTLCYNLLSCLPFLPKVRCYRASTLGFLHQLPIVLPSVLALTRTGLSPVSRPQLRWARKVQKS